jgi:hypothetical protein
MKPIRRKIRRNSKISEQNKYSNQHFQQLSRFSLALTKMEKMKYRRKLVTYTVRIQKNTGYGITSLSKDNSQISALAKDKFKRSFFIMKDSCCNIKT